MSLMNDPGQFVDSLPGQHNDTGRHAPTLDWREMKPADHFVQFYESDLALVDAVSGFLGAGLVVGECGIVIATPVHRAGIEQLLREQGVDLETARAQGQYLALDAEETLARFMLEGVPDPLRFEETVGKVVAQAGAEGSGVRA